MSTPNVGIVTITATGTDQKSAVLLPTTAGIAIINGAAGTGVQLPQMTTGSQYTIINNPSNANAITVYPFSSGKINGAPSYSIASGGTIALANIDGLNWDISSGIIPGTPIGMLGAGIAATGNDISTAAQLPISCLSDTTFYTVVFGTGADSLGVILPIAPPVGSVCRLLANARSIDDTDPHNFYTVYPAPGDYFFAAQASVALVSNSMITFTYAQVATNHFWVCTPNTPTVPPGMSDQISPIYPMVALTGADITIHGGSQIFVGEGVTGTTHITFGAAASTGTTVDIYIADNKTQVQIIAEDGSFYPFVGTVTCSTGIASTILNGSAKSALTVTGPARIQVFGGIQTWYCDITVIAATKITSP